MITSKSFLTVLFLFTTFFIPLNAEDLIISGGNVYLAGDQYYDNVIITNGGILHLVEYGGSNEDQGTLRLYCDSLYLGETSYIMADGAGGQYGNSVGTNGDNGSDYGRWSGGGGFLNDEKSSPCTLIWACPRDHKMVTRKGDDFIVEVSLEEFDIATENNSWFNA